jgi:hypothetical protein
LSSSSGAGKTTNTIINNGDLSAWTAPSDFVGGSITADTTEVEYPFTVTMSDEWSATGTDKVAPSVSGDHVSCTYENMTANCTTTDTSTVHIAFPSSWALSNGQTSMTTVLNRSNGLWTSTNPELSSSNGQDFIITARDLNTWKPAKRLTVVQKTNYDSIKDIDYGPCSTTDRTNKELSQNAADVALPANSVSCIHLKPTDLTIRVTTDGNGIITNQNIVDASGKVTASSGQWSLSAELSSDRSIINVTVDSASLTKDLTINLVNNESQPLSEAKFIATSDDGSESTTMSTSANGKLVFSGLDGYKTWTIKQLNTVSGYERFSYSFLVSYHVDSDNWSIDSSNTEDTHENTIASDTTADEVVIVNNPIITMIPSTGGRPVILFYAVAAMLLAVVMMATRKKVLD